MENTNDLEQIETQDKEVGDNSNEKQPSLDEILTIMITQTLLQCVTEKTAVPLDELVKLNSLRPPNNGATL